MDNFMSLKIKAISENEAFARSAVAAFCVDANPTVDKDPEAVVEIDVTRSGGKVHIEVRDTGVGIPDIQKARAPFYTTKPDEERSGMGFTVMESFMDELEVKPNSPHGLIVSMTKSLGNTD